MGSSLLLYCSFCFFFPFTFSGPISFSSIRPNFTASYLQFVDNSGAFLASNNGSFQARITNSKPESRSFYFVVVHVLSNFVIWSANRNHPVSQSSQLRFTPDSLSLYNDTTLHPVWSTNRSPVSSMQLLESGNLVLLDEKNNILWQSFDSPTDVLVRGQKLSVGESLVSSSSDEDLSQGSYKLVIGDGDAMLQWNGLSYWKLSMDRNAFRDTNFRVEYMVMNQTGVFLIGANEVVVISVVFSANSSTNFQMVKLDQKGVLSIVEFNSIDRTSKQAFAGPSDVCRIPYICRRLGVCTNGGSCACSPGFHSLNNGDCVPTDTSLVLPGSCNGSDTAFKYLNLRGDSDYFSNGFTDAVMNNVNLSFCQSLCSRNCSCLGVFYGQSSGSCYMINDYLGSVFIKSGAINRFGFVKTIAVGSPISDTENNKSGFPVLGAVLLPISGVTVIAIAIVGTLIWLRVRRRRLLEKRASSKLHRGYSASSDEEINFVAIPGLPVRFDYQQLAEATDSFSAQIGSGGFGIVYKGTLQDGTDIAVKKITCLGAQGKREFLAEIAVIGKVHHVNLVRLKGFCAYRGQRLLVYEFMKRGSLDRTLFHGDPVLEWKERYEIAVGTARGLAYLHSGCEYKIIHCDVKPENILLHDASQVKISDFGMSKLLSPEQSGLFTTLRGTRGYLAPEWLTSSAISDKSDVYSYGMLLLEIIRGKKNSSPQTQSNNSNLNAVSSPWSGESSHRVIYFPLYALEMHEEGRYSELVDPRLGGRVKNEDVEMLVRVALCCVQEDPNLRPSMTTVVGMLEGAVAPGEPRMESLSFLRFYGRSFTEASTAEANELVLYRQQMNDNSTSTSSYNSFSYVSSHQVSGPR